MNHQDMPFPCQLWLPPMLRRGSASRLVTALHLPVKAAADAVASFWFAFDSAVSWV